MHELVKQHLLRAQRRIKWQADKHRSEREFAVRDLVFLKIQPYVQSSLAPLSSQKLLFKFFGPYRIIQRVGAVAYRLEFPASSRIHPVFHISQLRRSPGNLQVSTQLPSELTIFQVPERILQRRWTDGTHAAEQVLVKWSHMLASYLPGKILLLYNSSFLVLRPRVMPELNMGGCQSSCYDTSHGACVLFV